MDMLEGGLERTLVCFTFKGINKPHRNTNVLDLMKLYLVFVNRRLGIQQAVMHLGHPNVPVIFY